jgi:hypothetical protein
MRGIFLLGICIAAVYWFDQSQHGGMYRRATMDMAHNIAVSFH